MFAFPSFNTEKDVIAYKSFMLADRMEAQWSQNSQNVLLLMVLTNFILPQFHELFSQISNFAANKYVSIFALLQFHEFIYPNFQFCRQFIYSIFTLLQFHKLFSQISNFASNLLSQF